MSARRHSSYLFLPLACSGVLALLAVLWLLPGTSARWRQWQPPAPQMPALDDVQQLMLHFNPRAGAAFPATRERPLLRSNRRPAPAQVDKNAQPAQPIDQARLQGLLDGPALAGALIDYAGETRFVRVGESIGGWRLSGVSDAALTLERDGQRREIELPFLSASDAAPAHASPVARRPSPARAQVGQPAPPPATMPTPATSQVNAPASLVVPPNPAASAVPAPVSTPPHQGAARPAASGPAVPRASFGGGSARP